MAGEYKSACGCKIHVAQWTSKRKIVTQESCLLHKAAAETLAERDALKAANERLREALRAANLIIHANLCPFGHALAKGLETCDCNYHQAAELVRAALAEGKGERDAS